jgi:glycosyltransferase involved in cell wall biosynthesis
MTQPFATCTVVVPCYNGAAELEPAVASVLAQTFADFHLVLVDDASTDGTLALMRRLADAQPRITVLALPENGGRSRARNLGALSTRGPFVAFLDHDDTYHPEFLSEAVRVLGEMPEMDRVKVLPRVSIDLDPLRYQAVANSLVTTSLTRREAFDFIGGWPEGEVFRGHEHAGEDVAFELLFGTCFATALLQKQLYNYFHRPGNSLDRFLKRSVIKDGALASTEAGTESDKALAAEYTRLRMRLRQRIRLLCLQVGRERGLRNIDEAP